MIVIDENLHDQRVMDAISAWYPGQLHRHGRSAQRAHL